MEKARVLLVTYRWSIKDLEFGHKESMRKVDVNFWAVGANGPA